MSIRPVQEDAFAETFEIVRWLIRFVIDSGHAPASSEVAKLRRLTCATESSQLFWTSYGGKPIIVSTHQVMIVRAPRIVVSR